MFQVEIIMLHGNIGSLLTFLWLVIYINNQHNLIMLTENVIQESINVPLIQFRSLE